jgi:hypothetical protein
MQDVVVAVPPASLTAIPPAPTVSIAVPVSAAAAIAMTPVPITIATSGPLYALATRAIASIQERDPGYHHHDDHHGDPVQLLLVAIAALLLAAGIRIRNELQRDLRPRS